jgi:hypothetical protein
LEVLPLPKGHMKGAEHRLLVKLSKLSPAHGSVANAGRGCGNSMDDLPSPPVRPLPLPFLIGAITGLHLHRLRHLIEEDVCRRGHPQRGGVRVGYLVVRV